MDLSLRRNYTTSGSLENLSGHHDKESYPHYHSVLSRHRPFHHSSIPSILEKEKPRKGKIIRDSVSILPTIQDEEARDESKIRDIDFPFLSFGTFGTES